VSDITRILNAIDDDDPHGAHELLPLVYDELRRLAAAQMKREKPGQTLNGTALVHDAYLRLVQSNQPAASAKVFANRRHFFAAAAEAMRRILVEKARRKKRLRHGGGLQQQPLQGNEPAIEPGLAGVDLLALNEALERLEVLSPRRAQLVKLRYFAGLTLPEVAELLGVSQSTAEADWTYAKTWLKRALETA
jgi:RNA polymerase sigma factor (TIGR02999 family)